MRGSKTGFTLIEIVVTVAITAIVVSSLGMILMGTVDSKIAVEQEARARRLGPAIMATIAADLRNAWATGPVQDIEVDGSWFRGEHNGGDDDAMDEMWFVTSVDSYMKYEGISSDLTEVGYYLKENDAEAGSALEGKFSLYRREDFLVDKRQDEGGIGILMHDRVVSFRVWYYDLPRDAVTEEGGIDPAALEEIVNKDSSVQEDSWDTADAGRLPYAVRVELILDATLIDAYNRKHNPRYAVYETLVRLPDFPKIDENFKLFTAEAPAAPAPPAENNGNNNGGNNNGGNNNNGG
jgi:prepilin-type N-terminal cleavage/methylation domain-containing protein